MKKRYLYIILYILSINIWGQNPQLAKKYLENADYDKAIYEYNLLVKQFPYKEAYLLDLIKAYQAQGKFAEVSRLLKERHPKQKPHYWVHLGYNFQLQKDTMQAQKYYDKAIKAVTKRQYYAYAVAEAFKNYYLLDEALQTYQTAMQNNKNTNFYMQMALLYAQKNEPDLMVENFLKLADENSVYQSRIKYYLTKYITTDPENTYNRALKKQLIGKIKETRQPQWYSLLQWLYVQQKDYKKAFVQLKSLYKKEVVGIGEIFHLGKTAQTAGKTAAAQSIFTYVIMQKPQSAYAELSKLALLNIDLKQLLNSEKIQQIDTLFQQYLNENWQTKNAVALRVLYADFLAFHQKQSEKALSVLKQLKKQPLSSRQLAEVNLKEADILLYKQKFSQALILYTQVQLNFPNHSIGHKATYDIARASFFQGDIDWAHAQLKVIKSVADDLIANDAIDLDVLIINNKEENDSLQTGLKKYARAQFEIFRKNPDNALQKLDSLTKEFKGQLIYDDALFAQAKLYEQQEQMHKALQNYQAILDNQTEDLLKDDALFRMAKIYEQEGDFVQAKKLFKKIILEYPASFWFVDAQKHFRKLRGDEVN